MKKLFRLDTLLLFIPLMFLLSLSLFNMLNTPLINDIYDNYFNKQLIWIIIGIIIFFITLHIPPKWINKLAPYLYYINLLLLVLVLFYGVRINGSKAWFRWGELAFQPSELMKISLILYSINLKHKHDITYILKLSFITIIPIILVYFEPDTGAIIFYLIIYLCNIFFKNIKHIYKYLIFLLLIGGLCLFIYLFFYHEDFLIKYLGSSVYYRMDRLINFRNGYQIENALIAIGSSKPINLKLHDISLYVPEAPTDFIFTFSIGNFGYIFGILIILCYFLISYYLLKKAKQNSLAINIFFIFIVEIIINIAMNLNVFPIMGIPLPFLSYGGSNMIISFIALALVINKTSKDDNNNYNHNYSPLDNMAVVDNN